tara:strand:- start:7893 stop:8126 length:234 start_codon:yes stop_codon:yes gene_type:complete
MAGRIKHKYRLAKAMEYIKRFADEDGVFDIRAVVTYCNESGNRYASTNAQQLTNLLRSRWDIVSSGKPFIWIYNGER